MPRFSDVMRMRTHGKMPKDRLLGIITEFLKGQTMCTLCTCRASVPRATPLEYYSNGTTLYMIGHKGIKLGNIAANPNVSVGVYNHVHPKWGESGNWLGVKGAQITGKARIIRDANPEFFEARKNWTSPTTPRVSSGEKPQGRIMIVIESKRIEYMDAAFKLEGLANKQVWKASE